MVQVMALWNMLRLYFIVFTSMFIGAEGLGWLCGYSINLSSVVVCLIGLVAVMSCCVMDYFDLVDKGRDM